VRYLIAILLVAACSSGTSDPPRSVVREVRARPYAIDPGGVGPYRLGATQNEVFETLPPEQGIPRVVIFDVERVLDTSIILAEQETVLLGGRPGERVSFVAVLAPTIAQAEGGVRVGSSVQDLAALGPEKVGRTARDPRIFVPLSLPGARFVVHGERVIAILLREADEGAPALCKATPPASEDDIRAAAGLACGRVRAACLTSAAKEAIVTDGDALVVVAADGPKARKVVESVIPGLVWAAPLYGGDHRDEIVAIVERRDDETLIETLIAMHLEGDKLVRTLEEKVYELSSTSAQWIGANLADVRLLLTVEPRGDGYEVGGILVHANDARVRVVAPLVLRPVERKRGARIRKSDPHRHDDAEVLVGAEPLERPWVELAAELRTDMVRVHRAEQFDHVLGVEPDRNGLAGEVGLELLGDLADVRVVAGDELDAAGIGIPSRPRPTPERHASQQRDAGPSP